jgi:hypothetical protein
MCIPVALEQVEQALVLVEAGSGWVDSPPWEDTQRYRDHLAPLFPVTQEPGARYIPLPQAQTVAYATSCQYR